MSFNIILLKGFVHLADAVILCSGGHTRIWKSSSRKHENTGDGFYLALKLVITIDMEMVQFHLQEWLFQRNWDIGHESEGGRLINNNGEGLWTNMIWKRWSSTRDKVAIANYKEIIEVEEQKMGSFSWHP